MRILVLGATGMLGHVVVRVLSEKADWSVYGTVRTENARRFFDPEVAGKLLAGLDVESPDALARAFVFARPQVVINCIGVVKQLAEAHDPLHALQINALLPHRLASLCKLADARLVHISTDCVYAGDKGGYRESDPSDARDLYGRSKYLGEVAYPHSITLRTSIIGHELQNGHGLINWFLSQEGKCSGYTRTIFSGLPTVILARIIRDVVIPRPELHGVYHVAAKPLSKYHLLELVAAEYGKDIEIIPDDRLAIDRSLDPASFHEATGYVAPEWTEMIRSMHQFQ